MPGYKRVGRPIRRRSSQTSKRRRLTAVAGRRQFVSAKRRRGYAPRVVRSLGTIIPENARVKFHAADVWTMDVVSTPYRSYNAFDPHDPVTGASTTMCSGFPELMSIYRFGICYASKISVALHPGNSGNVLGYEGIKYFSSSESAIMPSSNDVSENPVHLRYVLTSNTTCNERYPKYFKYYMKQKTIENKRFLDPVSYQFTSSTSPTINPVAWVFCLTANTSGGSPLSWNARVRITYYCKVFSKRMLGV